MDCTVHGIVQAGILAGVGSFSLLQGIFPTQGSNPGLPHCKRILYQLSQCSHELLLIAQNSFLEMLAAVLQGYENITRTPASEKLIYSISHHVNICGKFQIPIMIHFIISYHLQFSSVAQSCLTLCDPMDCSTPGLPVHHQLPESTQTQCPLS